MVPSGEMRPTRDAISPCGRMEDSVADADADAGADADAAVLRVVILSRRWYCTFGSSSSPLINGEVLLFYRYDVDDTMRMRRYQVGFGFDLLLR